MNERYSKYYEIAYHIMLELGVMEFSVFNKIGDVINIVFT